MLRRATSDTVGLYKDFAVSLGEATKRTILLAPLFASLPLVFGLSARPKRA
jgi:hypothetical protein